jgi:UDP-glucose 4-epimerase
VKILILGGHGFIGSHTSNILKSMGHTIGVVDCYHRYYTFPKAEYDKISELRIQHSNADLVYNGHIEDVPFMENVFKQFKPEVVIHVATYPNAYMVKRNVIDATGNMITATATILDLCVEHKVGKIVFASSSMVYGDFKVDAPDENEETNPLTLYGSYKLMGEKMCKIWLREKDLNYTILRPSALYGTRDMITRVISKMTESAIKSGIIKVYGATNKLDFSWVEDVASAFAISATDDNTTNKTFNCTRGKGRMIIEAAEMVRSKFGGKILEYPADDFYPNRDTLNSDKLKYATEWSPKVDIEKGVPEYLNWFEKIYDKATLSR